MLALIKVVVAIVNLHTNENLTKMPLEQCTCRCCSKFLFWALINSCWSLLCHWRLRDTSHIRTCLTSQLPVTCPASQFFPVALGKFPYKSNLREEEFSLLHSSRVQTVMGGKDMAAGSWSSNNITSTSRKQRAMNSCCAQLPFSSHTV